MASRTLVWLLLATSVGFDQCGPLHLDHCLSSAGVAGSSWSCGAVELWGTPC